MQTHRVAITIVLLMLALPLVQADPGNKRILHDPIVILRDSDFTPDNGVTRGAGTPENPYLIENWEIDASQGPSGVLVVVPRPTGIAFLMTNGQGILIANTTAHFVIRNVNVHGGSDVVDAPLKAGIVLVNLSSATVERSFLLENNAGVFSLWVNKSVVKHNTAVGNEVGLEFWASDQNMVEGNLVNEGGIGIEIADGSSGNFFANNVVKRTSVSGVWLSGHSATGEAGSNRFVRNLIRDNRDVGITITFVTGNAFEENFVAGSPVGIRVFQASRILLSDNFLLSNGFGLQLRFTSFSTVSGNMIVHNGVGIGTCAGLGNVMEANRLIANRNETVQLSPCL